MKLAHFLEIIDDNGYFLWITTWIGSRVELDLAYTIHLVLCEYRNACVYVCMCVFDT